MTVELCRDDGCYVANQSLEATWRVGRTVATELESIEASVLWFTEGKGDEDLHVHHFQRWHDGHLAELDLGASHRIQCLLPASPLSYAGTLIRIGWCVRVRMFRKGNRECVAQQPFFMVTHPVR